MPTLSPSYTLGLVFIVLVALIWAASSILVQYLYSDAFSFDSPFLLTYVGVSLFTLWLPVHYAFTNTNTNTSNSTMTPENGRPTRQLLQHHVSSHGVELGPHHRCAAAYQSLSASPADNEDEPQVEDSPHGSNSSSSSSSSTTSDNYDNNSNYSWTHADHRSAAFRIAPVWFLANWSYNASLAYTSITSSTVLASTGSLFTFLFAVATRDEHFTRTKFTGVVLGVLGSAITAYHDGNNSSSSSSTATNGTTSRTAMTNDESSSSSLLLLLLLSSHHRLGDVLGIVSAVGYGAYAVQTRLLCPHREDLYSMQLILGYIGLFNMTVLSPMALYCYYELMKTTTGTTTTTATTTILEDGSKNDSSPSSHHLTWLVLGFLVLKGLFDNVLSDYLWLRAVILTNATVATVGLGLTIPLALLSDIVLLGHKSTAWTPGSIGGALTVMAGFVFVNVGSSSSMDDERNNTSRAVVVLETAAEFADDDEPPASTWNGHEPLPPDAFLLSTTTTQPFTQVEMRAAATHILD
jgi:solute carrier family 35, member F5